MEKVYFKCYTRIFVHMSKFQFQQKFGFNIININKQSLRLLLILTTVYTFVSTKYHCISTSMQLNIVQVTIIFFYPVVVQVIHRRKMAAPVTDSVREKALADYRKKLLEHKELEARLKESMFQYLNRLVNKNQFKLR